MKTDIKTLSLHNIILPDMSVCSEKELYFRTTDDGAVYCENEKILKIQKSVSFDTYFNSFAMGKYNRYCNFLSLYLRVKFYGLFVLRIFSVSKCDGKFNEKCIVEKKLNSEKAECNVTEIVLDNPEDSAQIYFTLTALKESVFYGGEFGCKTDCVNAVNLAAVICTFKREKYLLQNIEKINEYLKKSSDFTPENIHFYIVDNGRTVEKKIVENEYISLIYNKNTGGSGGFKRGYVQAVHSHKNYTDILFMDDDIVLDCEMLFRLLRILTVKKSELSDLAIGGTMLKLSNQCIEHEAGAIWNGKQIKGIGNGLDMSERENVFEVSYFPKGNYNGWWFYCFPLQWYARYGYPLQFFVKIDDIEYSVRCAKEIAIINGLAVWHEDFENKYDGYQEYYIKRNELILASVNNQKPYTLFQIRKLVVNIMKQVAFQRYFLADLVFRAYDDYLLGWKHFADIDTEKLNLELMALCKPMMSDDELKEKYNVYFDNEKYNHSLQETDNMKKQALSLNGYLIPSYFYHKDKDGFVIADLAKCRFVNFYKHKKVLQYDIAKRKGFVTEQKRTKLLKYIFMLIGKSVKFMIKYPKVRKEFKNHLNDISKE